MSKVVNNLRVKLNKTTATLRYTKRNIRRTGVEETVPMDSFTSFEKTWWMLLFCCKISWRNLHVWICRTEFKAFGGSNYPWKSDTLITWESTICF